jgi:hypothetical protein
MELRKIVPLLLFLLATTAVKAQVVDVNLDPKNVAAIAENTSLVVGFEEFHNTDIKGIAKAKKLIEKYASGMAAIKTLYAQSLQNIDGFDQETQIYKDIVFTATDVFKDIPVALVELKKRPYSAFACTNDMKNLFLEATSAVSVFAKIVTNGKVSIKLKELDPNGSTDGANYLNRNDRYVMANQVLTTLTDIKYRLEAIIYIAQFCNGISDILASLDVDTWYNLAEGEAIANLIIEDYKSF